MILERSRSEWNIKRFSGETLEKFAQFFASNIDLSNFRLGKKLSKLFQGFTRKPLDIPFTSTSLKNHIPLFYQKYGKNKKLHLDLNFKDVKVLFGNFDTDIIFEYTMIMNWEPDDKGAADPAARG
jgi:hypothetical protein